MISVVGWKISVERKDVLKAPSFAELHDPLPDEDEGGSLLGCSLLDDECGSLLGCSLLDDECGSLLGCSLLDEECGSLLGCSLLDEECGSLLGCSLLDDECGSLLGCSLLDDECGSLLGCSLLDDDWASKAAGSGLVAFGSAGASAPPNLRKKFFNAANMAGPYQTNTADGKKVSAFEATIFGPRNAKYYYPSRFRSSDGDLDIP